MLSSIHMSTKAINALSANGITTVDKLRSFTIDQLKSLYWINNKVLADINAALESAGLSLGGSLSATVLKLFFPKQISRGMSTKNLWEKSPKR